MATAGRAVWSAVGARRGAIGLAVGRNGEWRGRGDRRRRQGSARRRRVSAAARGGHTLGCAMGCTRRRNGVRSAAERGREREQRGHGVRRRRRSSAGGRGNRRRCGEGAQWGAQGRTAGWIGAEWGAHWAHAWRSAAAVEVSAAVQRGRGNQQRRGRAAALRRGCGGRGGRRVKEAARSRLMRDQTTNLRRPVMGIATLGGYEVLYKRCVHAGAVWGKRLLVLLVPYKLFPQICGNGFGERDSFFLFM
ncbi:hypothetical protein C8R44DRAFT_90050 [Mycena epipterygia]|nr:hypothetical protein C8R44DRAFT_90050 [Mycena epipterygia]